MCRYAIDLSHISYSYEKHKILDDLSLKVRRGEHVGILGDSGCGKSTLLKLLAGLYKADSGTILVAGMEEPWKIRR